MTDINTYRIRIGTFNQKFRDRKNFNKSDYDNKSTSDENAVNDLKTILRMVLLLCLIVGIFPRNLKQNQGADKFLMSDTMLASQVEKAMTQCQLMGVFRSFKDVKKILEF